MLPAVLCLELHYCRLPLFALLLLAPLRVSMALPLRCLGLLGLLVYMQFAPGFSAASFLPPFCATPLASAAGLFGFASPLSRPSSAPCFPAVCSRVFSVLFSYSFLRYSCCLRCGSLCFSSASAGSFIDFVGSTPQPGYAQASAPLSGTSTAPSVLLSQCLVWVLLSLWSGFVAQVATGAVAPVPEAFVPHLCLPPLTLVSALMVAILMLAAGSSQAPLPTCSFSWSSSCS